jgi:polysaccharide export outer membrane protein
LTDVPIILRSEALSTGRSILLRAARGAPGDHEAIALQAEGPMKGEKRHSGRSFVPCILWGICAASVGCVTGGGDVQPEAPIPRELRMTTLPTYVIEPPDILVITTMRVVPKPPYHVQPLDGLFVQATNTLKEKEINGIYWIEPDGNLNLGLGYGKVRVVGLTIEEAQKAVAEHLGKILKSPNVQVSLGQSRAMQQIQGDHLVRQDGTIGLGVYGSVYVTGMTIDQARRTIEGYLGQYLQEPEIALDVYSYNSKWYYIIQDRAGYGQTILRFPITGRDTVLDALSNMGGTMYMSSNKHIWLARPNGQDPNNMQIFPVNWPALTQGGSPATNYQLMPGDRLFVQSNRFINANNRLSQFFAPINNVLGFTLLGSSTVSTVEGTIQQFQNGGLGGGGFGGIGGFR